MTFCPNCRNKNINDTVYRGIQSCPDCGAEFRGDVTFKEGTYRTFMENVLNNVAGYLQPIAASAVINIRDHALNDKEDVQSVVEALMELTENVNTGNVLGYDRVEDVSKIVEGIEKIVSYAKVMASRNEISERAAYRMAILEGVDPASWQFPPSEIPDLPGEIHDEIPPSAGEIIAADQEVAPMGAGAPGVPSEFELDPNNPQGMETPDLPGETGIPYEEAMWMGEKIRFNVEECDGMVKYNVTKEDGTPMISYNNELGSHEGLDSFSEDQLAELDAAIAASKVQAPVDGLDPANNVEGTVVSTEVQDPAQEAEALSQGMMQDPGVDPTMDSAACAAPVDELANAPEIEIPDVDAGAAPAAPAVDHKSKPIYNHVINTLKGKIKRGTYTQEEAHKAFKRVVNQSSAHEEAKNLLDEFEAAHVNGPIGAPAAQSAPAVDGPIGEPAIDEQQVDGGIGAPAAQVAPEVDGGIGAPVVDEGDDELAQINGVMNPEGEEGIVSPEGEVDPEAAEAAEEAEAEAAAHEEAEAAAIEVVGSKAEKAEAKIEAAKDAIENLEAAVAELTDIEAEEGGEEAGEIEAGEEAGEEEAEAEAEEGDIEGEVEPVDGDDGEEAGEDEEKEKIEELAKKKVGSHNYVAKPEIIPAKRASTGEKPDGKLVKYVTTKRDPSAPVGEQAYEEETEIPLTQAEVSKAKVNKDGEKKADAEKDAKNKDKYNKEDFKKGRPMDKSKVEEMTRFNGFRIGDKIKYPGYAKSFELTKISGSPVKFTLTEGKVSITVDPLHDPIELDGDMDLRKQRQSYILEDTRAVWEEMEKELNEGCAGGVCTLGGPMSALNSTSGVGNVASAGSMFVRTPLRSLAVEVSEKDVYAYIKNNSLHTTPRETAISHLMSNFSSSTVNVAKVFDDAVLSSRGGETQLNEVDSSYGYKSESTRGIDVERSLNEGYEELKKMGIV